MNAASSQMSRIDHDRVVLLQALQLLHAGYEVRARIEGYFDLPEPIYGYRPDVVAHAPARSWSLDCVMSTWIGSS